MTRITTWPKNLIFIYVLAFLIIQLATLTSQLSIQEGSNILFTVRIRKVCYGNTEWDCTPCLAGGSNAMRIGLRAVLSTVTHENKQMPLGPKQAVIGSMIIVLCIFFSLDNCKSYINTSCELANYLTFWGLSSFSIAISAFYWLKEIDNFFSSFHFPLSCLYIWKFRYF